MAKAIRNEACPRCRYNGQDRSGDNLVIYDDTSKHCFACEFHRNAPMSLEMFNYKKTVDDKEKIALPSDFTREVPAEGWKWLLQYGLPHSYWKAFTGYTPKENRLIITHGTPIRFSIGRALTVGTHKWKFYGGGHNYCETIGEKISDYVVVVEDIVSNHKVGQVAACLALFGTDIHKIAIQELLRLDRPVVLWLDQDQYQYLPKKIGRLQAFLRHPVRWISTEKDPKVYSLDKIKEILNESLHAPT